MRRTLLAGAACSAIGFGALHLSSPEPDVPVGDEVAAEADSVLVELADGAEVMLVATAEAGLAAASADGVSDDGAAQDGRSDDGANDDDEPRQDDRDDDEQRRRGERPKHDQRERA